MIDPADIDSRKRGPLEFEKGCFKFPEDLIGLGLEYDTNELEKNCLHSVTIK